MAKSKYKAAVYLLILVFVILQSAIILLMLQKEMTDYINDIIPATVLLSVLFYAIVKLKLNVNFNILLMTVLAVTLNYLFGEYADFNNTSPLYNRFQHFFGSFSSTLLIYIVIVKLSGQAVVNKIVEFIFLISLGACLGVFVEIAEFIKDSFFHPHEAYQAGLIDTDLDLISDMLGAFAAAIWVAFGSRVVQGDGSGGSGAGSSGIAQGDSSGGRFS